MGLKKCGFERREIYCMDVENYLVSLVDMNSPVPSFFFCDFRLFYMYSMNTETDIKRIDSNITLFWLNNWLTFLWNELKFILQYAQKIHQTV